jgi:hypothetical protein
VVGIGVALVAAVVGVLVDPVAGAWPVALACVPAAGLGGAAGAVVNLVMGAMTPAGTASSAWNLAPPEAAGMRIVYRTAWPPAIAVLGASPVIAAREAAANGTSGVDAALAGALAVVALSVLVGGWVRFRDDIKAWWSKQAEMAKGGGTT